MEEIAEIKKTLPYFLDKLDGTIDETVPVRDKMITSLSEAVLDTKWDLHGDSARVTEVKLAAVNSLSSLLNDKEKIRINRAKLALQDKTNDIMENVGKDIATILLKSTLFQGALATSNEEADKELERVFNDAGMKINPAELEEDPTKL